jgi:hypothetical protein
MFPRNRAPLRAIGYRPYISANRARQLPHRMSWFRRKTRSEASQKPRPPIHNKLGQSLYQGCFRFTVTQRKTGSAHPENRGRNSNSDSQTGDAAYRRRPFEFNASRRLLLLLPCPKIYCKAVFGEKGGCYQ